MQQLDTWWQARTKGERTIATIACLAFIFVTGVDIGRSLYQAVH